MNQPQHRPPWRCWVALFSLVSLLFLGAVSASHVHNTAAGSGVRKECQLCVIGGVSLTLTSIVHPLVTAGLIFFFSLIPVTLLLSARRRQPGDPRSPPLLS